MLSPWDWSIALTRTLKVHILASYGIDKLLRSLQESEMHQDTSLTTPLSSKWGVILLQYLTGSAFIDKVNYTSKFKTTLPALEDIPEEQWNTASIEWRSSQTGRRLLSPREMQMLQCSKNLCTLYREKSRHWTFSCHFCSLTPKVEKLGDFTQFLWLFDLSWPKFCLQIPLQISA